MERHEIPADALSDAWVAAIERGDEVVVVRDGVAIADVKPRARPVDIDAIVALRSRLPKLPGTASDFIRDVRDDPRW
ncbi:MAG: hypothetical protein A4S16_12555 [Proteobacteria bacterium SG_bin6]|nr:MAG: hypothetical protein A4S16_12555 [Proteobacteria bacterium SG_bin6]